LLLFFNHKPYKYTASVRLNGYKLIKNFALEKKLIYSFFKNRIKMKTKVFMTLIVACFSQFNSGIAQKTFDELMAGKNLVTKELPRPKYYKLDMRPDGGGLFPYFPGIPSIKKIAIVSSYLVDIMHFKTKTTRSVSYSFDFAWKTTTTTKTTSKTSTNDDLVFVSELGFYQSGLDAMKEVAKSKGLN
jgi:hypothetical protein